MRSVSLTSPASFVLHVITLLSLRSRRCGFHRSDRRFLRYPTVLIFFIVDSSILGFFAFIDLFSVCAEFCSLRSWACLCALLLLSDRCNIILVSDCNSWPISCLALSADSRDRLKEPPVRKILDYRFFVTHSTASF